MINLSELGFTFYATLGVLGTTILSLALVRLFLNDSTTYPSSNESVKKKNSKKDASKAKQSDKKHSKKNTTSNGVQDSVKNTENAAKPETPIVAASLSAAGATSKASTTKDMPKKPTSEPAKETPQKTSEETHDQTKKGSESSKNAKTQSATPSKQVSKEQDTPVPSVEKTVLKPVKASVSKSAPQTQPKITPPPVSPPTLVNSSTSEEHIVKLEVSKAPSVDGSENAELQGANKKKRKKAKKEGATENVLPTPDTVPATSVEPPVLSAKENEDPSSSAANDISPYTIHLRRRLAENMNLVDQMRKETAEFRKDSNDKKQEIQQLKVKLAEQMTSTQRLREQNMQLLEKHNALEQQWNILQTQFALNVHSLEQTKKLLEMEKKARVTAETAASSAALAAKTTQTNEGGPALKELQRENAALMQDLSAAKKMESELRSRLHQQTEDQNRKHELEHQLFSLRTLVESKDKEIQKLHNNVQELNTRITQMKDAEATSQEKYEQELKALRATVAPVKPEAVNHQENEHKLKELESQINGLNTEIAKQREKNDVLRERNWTVMNRIQELEKQPVCNVNPTTTSTIPELKPTHSERDEQLKSAGHVERANEYLAKQKKLQEEVETLKAKNNEIRQRNWAVMEELNVAREKMQQQAEEIKHLNTEMGQLAPLRDEVESLKTQLSSCTRVLSNTEHILATLQTSVEEEETKWRSALEASEAECDKARGELQRVYYELQRLQGNTDMSSKISRLTSELAEVCAERDLRTAEIKQLEERIATTHGSSKHGKSRKKSGNHCNGES